MRTNGTAIRLFRTATDINPVYKKVRSGASFSCGKPLTRLWRGNFMLSSINKIRKLTVWLDKSNTSHLES